MRGIVGTFTIARGRTAASLTLAVSCALFILAPSARAAEGPSPDSLATPATPVAATAPVFPVSPVPKPPEREAEFPKRVTKGVVTIVSADGAQPAGVVPFFQEYGTRGNILGSGVVISADGLILTADHCVAGASHVLVVSPELTWFDAAVIAREPRLDVAILRARAADLFPVPWRVKEPARVGEVVWAVGTPAVFSDAPTPSVSRGVVGALHRSLSRVGETDSAFFLADLIETDAQLSPGQSGGALVDSQGRLVGMCMAIYWPDSAGRARGFALPADAWLKGVIDALAATGRAPIGKLGVEVAPLARERAGHVSLPPRFGIEVTYVETGGPAASAGIVEGDVIASVGGQPVRVEGDLRRLEIRLAPGSKAAVSVIRAGVPLVISVTAGDAATPRDGGERATVSWRGMTLSDIGDEARKEFGRHLKSGVIVLSAAAGSPAYRGGIRRGDVILQINEETVNSLRDFSAAARGIPAANVVRVRTADGIGHIEGETGAR